MCRYLLSSSPLLSTKNRSCDGLSEMWEVPWTRSSSAFWSNASFWSDVSTFFRHAFLPFRDGWVGLIDAFEGLEGGAEGRGGRVEDAGFGTLAILRFLDMEGMTVLDLWVFWPWLDQLTFHHRLMFIKISRLSRIQREILVHIQKGKLACWNRQPQLPFLLFCIWGREGPISCGTFLFPSAST